MTPGPPPENREFVAAMHAFDAFCTAHERRFRCRWSHARAQYQNNQYWKSFKTIGALVVARGWDTEVFVEGALDELSKNYRHILPSDLLRPAVVNAFAEKYIKHKVVQDPRGEWNYLSQSLLMYVEATRASEHAILLSPTTPFPAWFRLVCFDHVDPKLLDWYGDIARQEFNDSKSLRMFCRAQAPVAFGELEKAWGIFADAEVINVLNPLHG